MKKSYLRTALPLPALALIAIMALAPLRAEKVVLLHTNDTHSTIEALSPEHGGILERKAIIDSVRRAEKNVMLIDAGDMVQGSLYFRFFKGDVEYPLFNMMNYDVRILGNHEFDNGLENLAKYYKDVKGARLSANYDFTDTPLKGMFAPYMIKKIGGKKIGFIGININPDGLISSENYTGLRYQNSIERANEVAAELKKKGCDIVVVVSHVGVSKKSGEPTDYDIAAASRDIDLIIGGHSHTLITPGTTDSEFPNIVKNAAGKDVMVVQTGRYGPYVGEVSIDTNKLGHGVEAFEYKLIPVTTRFPDAVLDKKMQKFIEPYKAKVDSVNARVVGHSEFDLDSSDPNGGYVNFISDFIRQYSQAAIDTLSPGKRVDIGMMNVGGIRHDMPEGKITEGQILNTFPFFNRLVVMQIKGSDFIEAMRVAASRGGEGISSNVRVVTDGNGGVRRVVIDGHEMNPEETYTLATIDYVANGNDKLASMKNGTVIWSDSADFAEVLLKYVEEQTALGLPIAPDMNGRFVEELQISK